MGRLGSQIFVLLRWLAAALAATPPPPPNTLQIQAVSDHVLHLPRVDNGLTWTREVKLTQGLRLLQVRASTVSALVLAGTDQIFSTGRSDCRDKESQGKQSSGWNTSPSARLRNDPVWEDAILSKLCNRKSPSTMKILAGKLFDSESAELLPHRLITVSPESGLITNVCEFANSPEGLVDAGVDLESSDTIDLRHQTVLPGLVDAHVHLFLHRYSDVSWEDQVTRESVAERTIRAVAHAKQTLMAGYTSVRDLGTEGAQDADLALRKCLSGPNAIIPGPRYFTANRAIVATGSYGPKNRLYPNRNGVDGVLGAEAVDGEVECRKEVRRQVGAGADWIKVYADYRMRSNMADVSPTTAAESIPTFREEELEAMKAEAHRLGVKITAHAQEPSTLASLARIRLDSIEHGSGMAALLGNSARNEASAASRDAELPMFWVPTLATFYTVGGDAWQRAADSFRQVLGDSSLGFEIACGGDTGVFAHGENALEMKVMVSLGADWRKVLQWSTLNGWRCIRSMRWERSAGSERLKRVEELREDARVVGDNEVPFGAVRKGFAADIIATSGELERDFDSAVDQKSIMFVMKGGKVYKRDGREMC